MSWDIGGKHLQRTYSALGFLGCYWDWAQTTERASDWVGGGPNRKAQPKGAPVVLGGAGAGGAARPNAVVHILAAMEERRTQRAVSVLSGLGLD